MTGFTPLPRSSLAGVLILLLLAAVGCDEQDLVSPSQPSLATVSSVGSFTETTAEPFGTFDGVAFLRHTGFFEGETSLGDYRVPFEIVAPEDPSEGSGSVLVEPPHWALPPVGRDLVIGQQVLFGRGMSYASVGFGTDAFNILDISVTDAVIAGEEVSPSPIVAFEGPSDEEILIQFVQALSSPSFASHVLGPIDQTYAYGLSQTADVLTETLLRVTGTPSADLFDLTLLHGASWPTPDEDVPSPGGPLEFIVGSFVPPTDVGRVLIVSAEGDLVAFDTEQFRNAAVLPQYRVYEVAGGAHLPTSDNPLDHWAVTRAVFVAGDGWLRLGNAPPASRLIQAAPEGEIDPVYADNPEVDPETGIARDADLNALDGVRMPDLAVGRSQFIASDLETSTLGIPGLELLTGSTVDLACEPEPGSGTDEPRFGSHGDYIQQFTSQVNELQGQGFLLAEDAEALKERAAESDVGKPGTCEA